MKDRDGGRRRRRGDQLCDASGRAFTGVDKGSSSSICERGNSRVCEAAIAGLGVPGVERGDREGGCRRGGYCS